MPATRKRKFTLAALLAALVAAGALVPLAYRQRQGVPRDTTVAAVPAPAVPAEPAETAPPPAPPGAEVVPPEESETDRGPAAASPAGPTLSFGRAAGLNLAPDPLHLSASAALAMDGESGDVLVHKNDQAVLPIASLTKLMTTLLVLEARQPMDEGLTITEEDVDTERHSRSRLRPGTKLTREEALHLALMSSENRAAHALGRNYPGGLPKLVEAMNAKAKQLGMKNTTYVDPTGLSNRNQSTVHDLALLVRTASQNSVMREFSTTPAHLASLGGKTLQYINSNRLVRNQRAGWNIELQKTGYIVEAGRCLTMVTKVAGRDLIMVLLDSDSNGTRIQDAERMRRFVVAQWGVPDTVAQAKPKAEAVHRVSAARKKDGAAPVRKAAMDAKSAKKAQKTTVAARETPSAKTVAKKTRSRTDVAGKGKASHGKEGRVHQSFASARGEQKG
jgi:D-alanyl-D-alanine endopeptidase (penicillin-binding protein 7)